MPQKRSAKTAKRSSSTRSARTPKRKQPSSPSQGNARKRASTTTRKNSASAKPPSAVGKVDRTPYLETLREIVLPKIKAYESRLAALPPYGKKTKVERLLAIDPGKVNLAVCFMRYDEKSIWAHEELVTSKITVPDFRTHIGNMIYLRRAVEAWVLAYQPDVIVKEGPALGMQFGVAEAGRIQELVEEIAFEFGIPCLTINPQKMRQFVGSKSKSDTKLWAFKKHGVEFATEDEADAFALAKTGEAVLAGTFDPRSAAEKKRAK